MEMHAYKPHSVSQKDLQSEAIEDESWQSSHVLPQISLQKETNMDKSSQPSRRTRRAKIVALIFAASAGHSRSRVFSST
jgi:hypothetical protein